MPVGMGSLSQNLWFLKYPAHGMLNWFKNIYVHQKHDTSSNKTP